MPIYAYKCGSCGHQKDALQKMSDAPLTVCPACGVAAFTKQVTAAGFQLKGSGWYATDFKGSPPAAAPVSEGGTSVPAAATTPATAAAGNTSPAPAAAAPSPAAAPATP